jgi:2-octaprenyl-6-methoxyphenol hydroxylase
MIHDVVIVGAGPNGLAAALAVGGSSLRQPLQVVLVDGRDPMQPVDDPRGTAITAAVQQMLGVLGVWRLLDARATPMREVRVTDGAGTHAARPSLLSFASGIGSPPASMVSNTDLNHALLEAVRASPAISLRGGFGVATWSAAAGHSVLRDTTGGEVKGRLVVAADGRKSLMRDLAGIHTTTKPYGQTALSFSISHERPHDHMAEEHFSADGVFALLPLAGDTSSIVWGMAPAEAERRMAQSEDAFVAELQATMGDRFGRVQLVGKRGSFPLVMQLAEHAVSTRLALVGDAAHAIHPLAGLGLNLGFKDVAALADCVMAAVGRGEDLGGAAVLQQYEAARRFDTLTTSLLMDAMNGVFVNDQPLLRDLRRLGLRLVDNLPSVKGMLMASAGGKSENSPRLLRGLLPG